MAATATRARSNGRPTPTPEESPLLIDRIESRRMRVPIKGVSPLLMNRFSEKAKRKMLESAQGKRVPKDPKDPEAEYEAAFYRLDKPDTFGMPADAFKEATVSAARFYSKKQLTMTSLNQFVFIHGVPSKKEGRALVEIVGEPTMQEDVVRVGQGTDLRYRPAFYPWSADLEVTFFCSAITKETILSLIDAGGLAVGVGDWRPEKHGTFGTYEIDKAQKVEVIG